MEKFDFIATPCLVDDLMDSGSIIGEDVELGFPLDPVISKGSPSHESDSGCSDMYEDRSVSPVDLLSPVGTDGQVEPELFDFDSLNDEDDLELASYLAVSDVKEKDNQATHSVEVIPTGSSVKIASPVIDVVSDSHDTDIPRLVPQTRRIVQAKAIVPKRSETVTIYPRSNIMKSVPLAPKVGSFDLRVLPSSSGRNNNSSESKKPTAVKVVKVIKTAAERQQDVENELMQALDDRNKKNAVQAKINREKKKAYIKNLEDENEDLRAENAELRAANDRDDSEKQALVEEVAYLKSVLANQSALAGLLKNIGNVENVKISSSLSRKRNADLDHDYAPTSKRPKVSTAGVCLHVDNGNVSLEFCAKCASMAKSSTEDENS